MDKPALLGIVRRRWYVLALGLVVSIALGYGATLANPPYYTARALVLLLPPETTVGEVGNPFLALSNLDLPARVVVAAVSSTSVRDDLNEEFDDITYSVTMEESTRGPVIAVDVTGTSEEETLAALPSLIQQTLSTLDRLQDEVNAPSSSSVRALLLTADQSATEQRGGTIRLAIAGVALGLIATVLLASAIDGRSRQRRARTVALQPTTAAAPPPEAPATVSPSTESRESRKSTGATKTGTTRNGKPSKGAARSRRTS